MQASFYLHYARPSVDTDPLSPANQRQAVFKVSSQILRCQERHDWLTMYGLLVWKSQLRQVIYDLFQMFNQLVTVSTHLICRGAVLGVIQLA